MPIYEYRCVKCLEVTEKIMPVNSSLVIKCEKCGEEAKRIISQSAFILCGEGWPGKNIKSESYTKNDKSLKDVVDT